jgi:uncharacterized FAD-dependent dehydrogenase
MIRIADIRIPLDYNMELLKGIAEQTLEIDPARIVKLEIASLSVNSKDKEDIHFVAAITVSITGDENEVIFRRKTKSITREIRIEYSIDYRKTCECTNGNSEPGECTNENKNSVEYTNDIEESGKCTNENSNPVKHANNGSLTNKQLNSRPIVVGCGPAGLFAALILAQAGTRPILIERGQDIDRRRTSVNNFWNTGELDTNSNVQFGEGGAGAFSDGKLKTGKKDPRKMMILETLVEAGAPPEIMFLSKPHIGTDRLNSTVKWIRNKIISLGGEVRFSTILTRIIHSEGRVKGVGFVKNGNYDEISCENVILAIGNSARDTIEALFADGVLMEQKAMAIGLRIEHPQELIDRIKYGKFAGHLSLSGLQPNLGVRNPNLSVTQPNLGAADYKMVVHLPSGRGVYTFCMCPGGNVVAAASEENAIVTNGMSEYARDGKNSNSAILVTIDKNDLQNIHPENNGKVNLQKLHTQRTDKYNLQNTHPFTIGENILQSTNPLAGINFQRRIESQAYAVGGGGYKAPVQRLEDFLLHRSSIGFGDVLPTYTPGTCFAQVDSYLPDYVSEAIRQAIKEMDEWMPGFAFPDALLTGPETRSSSPVRILRGANCQALGISGMFPCGEGAGYAGGIISAAVDGVICAEKILAGE